MAITIAAPDTVFDPFRNPAAAARLAHGFYFGSPTFYALSKNGGTGETHFAHRSRSRGAPATVVMSASLAAGRAIDRGRRRVVPSRNVIRTRSCWALGVVRGSLPGGGIDHDRLGSPGSTRCFAVGGSVPTKVATGSQG